MDAWCRWEEGAIGSRGERLDSKLSWEFGGCRNEGKDIYIYYARKDATRWRPSLLGWRLSLRKELRTLPGCSHFASQLIKHMVMVRMFAVDPGRMDWRTAGASKKLLVLFAPEAHQCW